jgi:hypothetical protein
MSCRNPRTSRLLTETAFEDSKNIFVLGEEVETPTVSGNKGQYLSPFSIF